MYIYIYIYILEAVKNVVDTCAKKRFELKEDNNAWHVRATQGHSLTEVSDSMHKAVTSIADIGKEEVVHGTFLSKWPAIRREGLRRMGRNHIHLCSDTPGGNVISGMRSCVQVVIWIDLQAVLQAGIAVYLSPNDVILTAGQDGVLSTNFFTKVMWMGPPAKALWGYGQDFTEMATLDCLELRNAWQLAKSEEQHSKDEPSPQARSRSHNRDRSATPCMSREDVIASPQQLPADDAPAVSVLPLPSDVSKHGDDYCIANPNVARADVDRQTHLPAPKRPPRKERANRRRGGWQVRLGVNKIYQKN